MCEMSECKLGTAVMTERCCHTGREVFFYLFLSVGLKFLFCLSRSVISTETEEDERFRVSSPRAGRPILIAAYFHQRQKDAAEEVQLGFKPRTTRGTYCTSSSDTEVLISISVFHPQIVTQ